MVTAQTTSAVGINPVVLKSYPVPYPKERTIRATSRSDDATRPRPARRSRVAYSPACQKTSSVIGMRNGSHSSNSVRQRRLQRTGSPKTMLRRTSAR